MAKPGEYHCAAGQRTEKGGRARLFPTAGGILRCMEKPNAGYTYMAVDGAQNCLEVLEDLLHGGLHHCFIEMSVCTGSCVGGPVMENSIVPRCGITRRWTA